MTCPVCLGAPLPDPCPICHGAGRVEGNRLRRYSSRERNYRRHVERRRRRA